MKTKPATPASLNYEIACSLEEKPSTQPKENEVSDGGYWIGSHGPNLTDVRDFDCKWVPRFNYSGELLKAWELAVMVRESGDPVIWKSWRKFMHPKAVSISNTAYLPDDYDLARLFSCAYLFTVDGITRTANAD